MKVTRRIINPVSNSTLQSIPRFKNHFGQLEDTGIRVDNLDKMIFTNQGFRFPNNAGKQKVLASNEIGDVSWKFSPLPVLPS